MTDIPEGIVQKIQRLFNLAESSNQHEAALAMQKALELMAKYSVDEVDLKKAERGKVSHIRIEIYGKVRQNWELELANGMCRIFNCTHLISRYYHSIIGRDKDLEVFEYLFVQLRTKLLELAYIETGKWTAQQKSKGKDPRNQVGSIHPKAYRTGWISGAVQSILNFLEIKYQALRTESDAYNAIVISSKADNDKYVADFFGKVGSHSIEDRTRSHGFLDGVEAGKKILIPDGIKSQGSDQKLLG